MMNMTYILASLRWGWVLGTLLGIVAGIACLAILSPRLFLRLDAWSSVWIDISKFTKRLDRGVDIEQRVLRHGRLFGAIVVVAAGVLAVFFTRFHYAGQWIVLTWLGFVGGVGVLALISPRLFSRLADRGNLWVDTDKLLEKLDYRIDIDRHVLQHCRLFGAAMLGTVAVLAAFLVWTA